MDKSNYALEVMYTAAGNLLGYKIDYEKNTDQYGEPMVWSLDLVGTNGYSIIKKRHLNTVNNCYDNGMSINECVNHICGLINKDKFVEKANDLSSMM